MKKVFIDGSAGTTGLRIRERLATRDDLEILILSEELRKDPSARRDALNAADVAFLCLPDTAAIEAVSMVENPNTVVIDTSTAHRTTDGWAYGFPELVGRRAEIAASKRIANPGCHASGFIALVEPLIRAGILASETALASFSLTGYSGGGKKMIADYDEQLSHCEKQSPAENQRHCEERSDVAIHSAYFGGRQYALTQSHKHLPEMVKICGLQKAPVFSPIVVPHLSGMEVSVHLHDVDLESVKACYRDYYANNGLVSFVEDASDAGFISSMALSGRDDMTVSAYGSDGRIILVALFDNLGKGASGAAIQNMNLALGCDEATGLVR